MEPTSDIDTRDIICLQLLGGFTITIGDRVITESGFRVRNAAHLIKILALEPSHALHREELIDWLWPDAPPEAAANNLRYALHIARRELRPHVSAANEVLRLIGNLVQLAPPTRVKTDISVFERAVESSRDTRNRAQLRRVLDLYTGDLLPGDRYQDWASARRESLREMYLRTMLKLATLEEASGDLPAAVELLEQTASEDPTREEAHVGLMRLYAVQGQRQLALRQYGRLRDALDRELDVEPETVSQQLYQAILLGRFPANASVTAEIAGEPEQAAPGRHNLPEPQDTFIGRNREIPEISALLKATRFLSLIGSGGVGKTRLALEVARRHTASFSGDIWFVDLATVTGASSVPGAVTATLHIPEAPGRNAVDQLITALQHSTILLILDNCEHLIDAVASLASTLLEACPEVRVLATSREPLRVSGEVTYRVPSLSVPQATAHVTSDLAEQPESVQLFVSRASRHDREFRLTDGNSAAIADICRTLDGIPLAIELAAARVSSSSLDQISSRIGEALHLLTDGDRIAPARHQTLRGALDWSFNLLSGLEQDLFRTLAVFAGGWTLDAAEAVWNKDQQSASVLDILAALVDRSLVVLEANRLGLRYRMLEPVRQYATERLVDHGKMEEARARHARFVAAFVTAGEPGLRGQSQGEWIGRFEAEHDNLRAALSWSLQHEPETALQIAAGSGRFWYVRSYGVEGRRMLHAALDAAPFAPPHTRARALSHAGILADEAGDHDEAASYLETALEIFREAGDDHGMATALNSLGAVAARSRGDFESARRFFEQSLELRRKLHDEAAANLVMSNLAAIALSMGDLDGAESLLNETIPYDRATGNEWSLAISMLHLGRILWERGDYLRAGDAFVEGSELSMRTGDQGAAAEGVEGIAGVAGATGMGELAATLFGAAEGLRDQISLPIPDPDLPFHNRMISIARASVSPAAFELAWSKGRTLSLEAALAMAAETVRQIQNRAAEPSVALTSREQEIVALIARGQTNSQIAEHLGIAVRTVDTHVSRILRKLGLSSRTGITESHTNTSGNR